MVSERVYGATAATNGSFHFNQKSRFLVLTKPIMPSQNKIGGTFEFNKSTEREVQSTDLSLFLYTHGAAVLLASEQVLKLSKYRTWMIKGRSSCFVVEIPEKSSRVFVSMLIVLIGLSNVFSTLVKHRWTPSFLRRSLQERSCTFANGDAMYRQFERNFNDDIFKRKKEKYHGSHFAPRWPPFWFRVNSCPVPWLQLDRKDLGNSLLMTGSA